MLILNSSIAGRPHAPWPRCPAFFTKTNQTSHRSIMKAEFLHIRVTEAAETHIELTFCASLTEHLPRLSQRLSTKS